MVELGPEEARVVASLAEKQLTTPQYYPLTLNALVNACNQLNNRDPVVSYEPPTVEAALGTLRSHGLARVIHAGGGSRTAKYRHTLDEVLGLDSRELALVTVLLLRGPQTVNELRTRTDRMAPFDSAEQVERDLLRLSEREEPLVRRLERQPGQKEARWEVTFAAKPTARRPDRSVRPVRIPPLADDELDERQRELLATLNVDGRSSGGLNIFRTLVRHPRLFRRWSAFGGVLLTGELPARLRELAILRTAWLTQADYEWGQHVAIALEAGVDRDEIGNVVAGAGADGWSPLEAAVLRATDELHGQSWIGDATWRALLGELDEHQLLELVFVVGQYHLVAFALNTLGVPREEGVEGLPE